MTNKSAPPYEGGVAEGGGGLTHLGIATDRRGDSSPNFVGIRTTPGTGILFPSLFFFQFLLTLLSIYLTNPSFSKHTFQERSTLMKTLYGLILILLFLVSTALLYSQQIVGDSAGTINKFVSTTDFGGFGETFYQYNSEAKTSTADLERVVFNARHRFDADISLYTELELLNAVVKGAKAGGTVDWEQAYVKFNMDTTHYFKAGLFMPSIGIQNEYHVPNTFNGVERTQVELNVIPTTWRDLGVGYYGDISGTSLKYSAAVFNGLNSAAFEHGSGITEGRYQGNDASANNLAVNAALKYAQDNVKAQVSGYYGGTVGLSSAAADKLGLNSGVFGTPVAIGEADIRYASCGFSLKALGTYISIPDAEQINSAYSNNTPKAEYGAYGEAGYDVLRGASTTGPQLIVFARYEKLDLNSTIPANGVYDPTLDQSHIVVGLNYMPITSIVLKADARFEHTAASVDQNTTFVTLGLAWVL
jgi:hypothetical protein